MSTAQDDRGDARRITSAVEEAQNMLAEFNTKRLWAAASGTNPDTDPSVRRTKIQLHAAVMLAFQRMRPHIKQQLSDKFWKVEVGDLEETKVEPWMTRLSVNGVAGLFVLDQFHSPVGSETKVTEQRHAGPTQQTRHMADLADMEFYRVVVQLLSECMARLGFGPEPEENTPRTEITQDTIDKFEEWRQQVTNGE